MANDVSKIILPGASAVSIGGTDVGFTDESGVKITVSTKKAEAKVALYGDTPVSDFIVSQNVKAEFILSQTDWASLALVLPGCTKVTSGANSRVDFGVYAGTRTTGVAVVFAPVATAYATVNKFTIFNAALDSEPEIVYSGDENGIQKWKVIVKGMIDTTKSNGQLLASYGDTSISADAVAPTVSAVTPLDAATGVATSTTVVLTFSKDLLLSSVTTDTVIVFRDNTSTKVSGAVGLVNNGASTQVTFTPGSALTALAKYLVVVNGVKSLAGVSNTFFTSDFTCA